VTIEATPLPTTRPTPFDPPEDYRKLREDQPVSRLAMADGSLGWLVTSYEHVRAVMSGPQFSSRPEKMGSPLRVITPEERAEFSVQPGMFISMDPPDHGRYRKLLTGQFTVRRMRALEPRIHQMVTDHLDAMEAAGDSADLVEAFALPIPSLVICELLGVPYEERDEFQARSSKMLDLSLPFEEVRSAAEGIDQYLKGLVASKRSAPGDDMLSGLFESDPTLTDDEVAAMGLLLLIAGHETTANMLGLGTFLLLQNPDQLDKLRANPDLMNGAVEELLRYLSVVQFGTQRVVLEDVEVGGQQFKAGETVVCSLAAANRDPARFDEPEILDITRTHSTHIAFGHGIHQCLGQQLSRVEMQIAFRGLFDRFPNLRLAVDPGEVKLRTMSVVYGAATLPVAW
jgi:cytochrome P450